MVDQSPLARTPRSTPALYLGIYDRKPFYEIDDAEWMRYFETNVLSGIRLAQDA